ncbi:MAG TPA: hypothetical protein VMT52_12650 [Planctomycetota bacterium]|nr:hypothetical protein [Planctomycetota bacterium]
MTGNPGEMVTLGVGIANDPERVTGFSFGVKHDAAKLTLGSVTIAPDLQSALGAENEPDARFFALNQTPAGGAGFTVAMILSPTDPNAAIPPGLDHHVFDVKYVIAAGATGGARVDVTGDLGNPKVAVVLDRNGVSQSPVGAAAVTSAAVIVAGTLQGFLRGDINQSGRLDVTDGILILDYLFTGSALQASQASRDNCIAVFNVDGSVLSGMPDEEDVSDTDITDALFLFQFLFQLGPLPPAPFPSCGESLNPVNEGVECRAFNCP